MKHFIPENFVTQTMLFCFYFLSQHPNDANKLARAQQFFNIFKTLISSASALCSFKSISYERIVLLRFINSQYCQNANSMNSNETVLLRAIFHFYS